MLEKGLKFITKLLGKKSPRTVIFEITDKCNLNCRYCYRPNAGTYAPDVLSLENLEKITANLRKSKDKLSIGISGGEPMLHPDFMEIVAEILKIDANANLLTNLTQLTKERAAKLKEIGLKSVQVTIFSPLPDQHNFLRGQDDFAKTMEGISVLRLANISIEAILLVTAFNADMVIPAIEMMNSLGINGFMINRYNASYPKGHKRSEELFLDKKKFLKMARELEDFAIKKEITIPFAIPIPPCVLPDKETFPHLEFTFCPVGRDAEYLTIGPSGKLRTCNHFPMILGDLCTQTIDEIIEQEPYANISKQINTPPVFCKGCVAWERCRGGCRAAAFSWSGDMKKPDPWVEKMAGVPLDGTEIHRPEFDSNDQWRKNGKE